MLIRDTFIFLQKNSIVEVPSGSKYTSGITATQIQGIYNEEPHK